MSNTIRTNQDNEIKAGDIVRRNGNGVSWKVERLDGSRACCISIRSGMRKWHRLARLQVIRRADSLPHEDCEVSVVDMAVHPGAVVRVGKGRTLYDVEEVRGSGDAVLMGAFNSRRRTAAVHTLTVVRSVDEADPDFQWNRMLCTKCGHERVVACRHDACWRRWCPNCPRATVHYLVRYEQGEDRRETQNADANDELAADLQLLHASLGMLDQLGVRWDIRQLDEDDAIVTCERGRGKSTWFVELDERLTIRDQVDRLGNCWRYMLPANSDHWSKWKQDTNDPEMQWQQVHWAHKKALIDDESIERALGALLDHRLNRRA